MGSGLGESRLAWVVDICSYVDEVVEEAAEAVEAVRVGIGTSMGNGEVLPPPLDDVDETEDGDGDWDGDVVVTCCLKRVCCGAAVVGSTRAMSPFGSLVGRSCTPVPFTLLKIIPFCAVIVGTWWASTAPGLGRMCTWTAWCCATCGCSVCCFNCVDPARQFAKCCSSLLFTVGSRPGNLPTSPAHSLNPARNLFKTAGSVAADIATCCLCRFSKCLTVISKISAFSSFE